jgi:HlyD family secretion protein
MDSLQGRAMRSTSPFGTAFVAVAIAFAATTVPATHARAADPPARAALVVTAARATTAPWPSVIPASGSIAAWQEAIVGARSNGVPIVAILADVGDRVTKGQLLARFDDAPLLAEFRRAEAALAQARAQAAEGAANLERAETLGGTDVLSKQELLNVRTIAASRNAAVAQAEASLQAARLTLEYTRVTAPDAGVITSRTATLGAVAQPGAELFRLIRQGRLEWRAELTAAQLGQVKPGLEAVVRTSDGQELRGRVRRVAPALDAGTRLGIAYVDLESSPAARASMYLKGEIRLAERVAITVPSASVIVRDGRTYVAALDGTRVRLVPVVAGRRSGDRVEVVNGLRAGDTVVVRGAGFLNDRDVVTVANDG